jgi:hypothetical protein
MNIHFQWINFVVKSGKLIKSLEQYKIYNQSFKKIHQTSSTPINKDTSNRIINCSKSESVNTREQK